MLSKKQITRAVTFISMSVLTGLSSAVSAGLIEEEPLEVQAAVTDTETSTHPIADEKGIKMYKKKKVMYARNGEHLDYVYKDVKVNEDNRIGYGGTFSLTAFQKITVLGEVKDTNWLYVSLRVFHHTDGKFYREKGFIKKNWVKSKLTAFEKSLVERSLRCGFDHVEDITYNGTLYLD